jgi:hypothetical protein
VIEQAMSRRVQSQYQAESETVDFDRDARERLGRDASGLRDDLERRKKDGSISKEGANSLTELDAVLSDNRISRDEVGRVKAAIDGLKNSHEASDRAVVEGRREISALSDGYTRSIQQLVAEMNRQRQQVRWLADKFKRTGDAR